MQPSTNPTFTRTESQEVRDLYRLTAPAYERTPDGIAQFIDELQRLTGLAKLLETCPVEKSAVESAAAAFAEAGINCFGARLDQHNPDPEQLDRFIDAYLVDPDVRLFLVGMVLRFGQSASETYRSAVEKIRVPPEPLLYYAMGAWWGQWLALHRFSAWSLYAPLRPIQCFPDMVTAGHTVCMLPFSQVNKKLSDPAGDQLSFKCSDILLRNYLPPFPMLSSLADGEQAVLDAIGEAGRAAAAAEKRDDCAGALRLYADAVVALPHDGRLLAMGATCAMRCRDLVAAEDYYKRILQLHPTMPLANHNLAVLYYSEGKLRAAVQCLRQALGVDPNYSQAHMTLAACLAELGDSYGARQHATWVRDNETKMAPEAEEFLARLG